MEQAAWYYQLNSRQIGPISPQELQNLLIQQILTPETYVWTQGMKNWQQIRTLGGFSASGIITSQPERPTSVTVLGILNIVFGTLNLMCTPFIFIGLFMPQPEGTPFAMGPGMKAYTAVGAIVGLIASGVLIGTGIGLLKLKDWARRMTSYYGWFALVWGVIGVIINGVMMSSSLSGMSEAETPALVGGMIGGMCGGIIGLIYPILLIIYMKRPNVIEACQQ